VSSDFDDLIADLRDNRTQAEHAEGQEREDRKHAKRARIHTIKDLLHEETEQAEPLLGYHVRRGQTTMVGGYGGAGKSTMSIEMVRAIVTGEEFLGVEGEGATALIVDLEQGMSVAQRRVYESFTGHSVGDNDLADLIADMDFGDHWGRVRYADWQEGADLSHDGPDLEVLEAEIAEHRPDVVLIDPIYKLFLGQNLNEQEVVSGFVKWVGTLRTKYNFALILPAHPRKPGQLGGSLSMHDLYGSAIWSWWAENVVMIQRGEGNTTSLRWEKDRMGQAPVGDKWTLTFEAGRGYRRSIDEAPHKPVHQSALIYEFLQHPERIGIGYTREQIADALKLTKNAVTKATERMEKRRNVDGTKWGGLHVERADGVPNRYSYRQTVDDRLIEEFKQQMDATEEDPR
jgi:hypothetical protein